MVFVATTATAATTAAAADNSNDDLYKYLTVGVLSLTALGVALVRCCATRRRVDEAEAKARRDDGVGTATDVLDAVGGGGAGAFRDAAHPARPGRSPVASATSAARGGE